MKKEIAKGHRSVVYLCKYRGKKAARKEERKDVAAINRIQNEVFWLRKLNKFGIGPRLYFSKDNFFICEFIEGERIIDFLKNSEKPKSVILEVLNQCRIMDRLNMDKKEMSNPYKHIIVKNKKVTLIDFERARFSLKPQNVTAFFAFLTSGQISSILRKKGIEINQNKLKKLLQNYKKSYSEKSFKNLVKMIKTC